MTDTQTAAHETEVVTDEEAAVEPQQQSSTLLQFQTDADAEVNGIEVEDINTGIVIVVAHIKNRRYRHYLNTLIRPYSSLLQSNSPKGYAFYEKAEAQAMAKFVLLGWSGLTDENGKDIPYSEEKAFELLYSPQWRQFREIVDAQAGNDANFGPDRVDLGKGFALGSSGSLLTEGT